MRSVLNPVHLALNTAECSQQFILTSNMMWYFFTLSLLSIVHRWCWWFTFPPIASIPLPLSEVFMSTVVSSLSPPPQYTYCWNDIQLTPDILYYTKLSCIFNMASLIWMDSAFLKTINYCRACDTVTSQKVWMCDIVMRLPTAVEV
jgi:hypothetical protein